MMNRFTTGWRAFCGTVRATFFEVVQEPAVLLLTLAAVALATLAPVFQFHQMGEAGRLAREGGLACLLMFGLPLAIVGAGAVVGRELENGTAAVALVKPLPRGVFLTGKCAGIAMAVAVFWWSVTVATLLAERASSRVVDTGTEVAEWKDVRLSLCVLAFMALVLAVAAAMNYYRRVRFGVAAFCGLPLGLMAVAAFSGFWRQDGSWHLDWQLQVAWRIVPVALLLLFALWIYCAFASALATRLGGVGTMGISFGLFFMGLCADAVVLGGRGGGFATTWWRELYGLLVPNVQHFWMADSLAHNGALAWQYVGVCALWAAAWCVVYLIAGGLLLRNRDVG